MINKWNGAQERLERGLGRLGWPLGGELARSSAPERVSGQSTDLDLYTLPPLGRFLAPVRAQLGAQGMTQINILAPEAPAMKEMMWKI